VRLAYRLVGYGWAECDIECGETRATVTASYLSDALDSLCAAIVALLRGDVEATATFAEEPGEYQWTFRTTSPGLVRVRIDFLGIDLLDRPRERIVFDAECALHLFARALLSELQRIVRELGSEGYREKWVDHEFPAERLVQLETLLAGDAPPNREPRHD
jgi:hypothetical protein